MLSHSIETPNKKFGLEKLKRSIMYKSGRYEVVVPWKDDRSVLPDNYETALRRLRSTEKPFLMNQKKGRVWKIPKKEKQLFGPVTYHTCLL